MLVQRCALEQNRLIVPVSITRPNFQSGSFESAFNQHQYRALVDTGAQRSVIARSIAADLKLMRTGHMQFAGLHGPKTHTRYLAAIAFWVKRIPPSASHRDYESAELTLFSIEEPFEIVDMDENANFEMILGFDILKLFTFSFSASDGIFELRVKS
ncbi:MAG: retroviral-like aspartic protease family protein [Novosphingobium sp.]